MDSQLFLPLIVTAAIAVAGWYVVHALAARRDQANKRREFRVENLIAVYRKLSNCADRPSQQELYDRAADLETAIADIHLFGSTEQIDHTRRLVEDMKTSKSARIDILLNLLRADLRKELRLPPVSEEITWVRVTPPEQGA